MSVPKIGTDFFFPTWLAALLRYEVCSSLYEVSLRETSIQYISERDKDIENPTELYEVSSIFEGVL